MKKLPIVFIIATLVTVVGFQNCQKETTIRSRTLFPSTALSTDLTVERITVENGSFQIYGDNLDQITQVVLVNSFTNAKTSMSFKANSKVSAEVSSSTRLNLLSNVIYNLLISTAKADVALPIQVDYKSIPHDGLVVGGNQLITKNGHVGVNTLDPSMGLGWGSAGEVILGVSGHGDGKANGYAGRGMLFLDNPIGQLQLGQSLGALVFTGQNLTSNKVYGFVDVVSSGASGETNNQLGGSFVFYTKMRGGGHQIAMVLKDDKSLEVRGNLSVGGNIVHGGTVSSSSDRNLKTNIKTIPDAVEKLLHLNGVYYNWKDASRGHDVQMGVIAQDVQDVFPELVHEDTNGYLAVNYQGLIAPLIEATKAQSKEIVELKNTIEKQKQLLEKMEARLSKVEASTR